MPAWANISETMAAATERFGNGSRAVGAVADDLEALTDAVGGLLESLADREGTPMSGDGSGLSFGMVEAAAALGVERSRVSRLAAEAGWRWAMAVQRV